jgi:hypothetical protein
VPQIGDAQGVLPGFSGPELSEFSAAHQLPLIARRLPWRGDADRLRTVAWWGSALADLALAAQQSDRGRILAEAGAFNVAVALFDSAVDGAGGQARPLVEALEPRRMTARLAHPGDSRHRIQCRDPSLGLVAGLFDQVLSSAGRRFRSRPAQLDRCARLLEEMYQSELWQSPEPFFAKAGPVIFIGALASDLDQGSWRRLYGALARLCRLWDDWQDMEEDLRGLAPNSFLGVPRLAPIGSVAYGLRGLTRVAAGELFHPGIAATLATGFRETVEAARDCDPDTCRKTLRFCRELMS